MGNLRKLEFSKGRLTEDPKGHHCIMTYCKTTMLGTIVDTEFRNGLDWLYVRHFNGEYWPVIPMASEVDILVVNYPETPDED